MAVVLGTVSSAFAVAELGVKAGSTLLKLRELWKEVQDVPEKIRHLMRQIGIYEPLLAEFDQYLEVDPVAAGGAVAMASSPGLVDVSMKGKASSYCREALTDLQDLVNDLSQGISSAERKKRGIGRVKVVLKKDDLNKFQSRLDRAFGLLQSAHIFQQSAKLDQQSAKLDQQLIHMEELRALANSQAPLVVQISQQVTMIGMDRRFPKDQDQSASVPTVISRKSLARKRTYHLPLRGSPFFGGIFTRSFKEDAPTARHTWVAQFRPPKWLCLKYWELLTQQTCAGWQINLTSFNMVPWESDVMEFARCNNWNGICELFREGRASPYDYDPDGGTLIESACFAGSFDVIVGLLQTEQAVTHSRLGSAILLYHQMDWKQIIEKDMQPLLDHGFFEWIAAEVAEFEPSDTGRRFLSDSAWYPPSNMGLFELHLQACLPYWDDLRPAHKKRMIQCSHDWPANHVRRLIRPGGDIQQEDMRKWTDDGISLLHWVIICFCYSEPRIFDHAAFRTDWQQLLTEVILAADNLHLLQDLNFRSRTEPFGDGGVPMTMLLCFFTAISRPVFYTTTQRIRPEARLNMLLAVLMSCGIDLDAYGRCEFGIWASQHGATHMETASCVKVLDFRWKLPRAKFRAVANSRRDVSYHRYARIIYCEDIVFAIHYGPRLEDWSIEFDRYRDWPLQFWNMVENPLQVEVMPGTWVDDNSDSD